MVDFVSSIKSGSYGLYVAILLLTVLVIVVNYIGIGTGTDWLSYISTTVTWGVPIMAAYGAWATRNKL